VFEPVPVEEKSLSCCPCFRRASDARCMSSLFTLGDRDGKVADSRVQTEQLDDTLHNLSPNSPQFPLSTWTYYQKLQNMMWIVQLGFELDVYLPDELSGMYWYVVFIAPFQQPHTKYPVSGIYPSSQTLYSRS
jgi:hypothetical protein